ncbi:ABC-three component system middle component 1 [Vibrio sp. TBV020]|uniref:ABC-three component system middle component 1 n=1 Tax=Vibrio sp. TBV020 TaxID=3137398 RepID=UPI0038CDA6E1
MFRKVSLDDVIINSSLFGDIRIELYQKYEQCDKDYFSCFFVKIDSEDSLRENWLEIVSYIGTEYISNLDSEFSIWNVYVVFALDGIVNRDIKYMIENNKLFLRKIVLDSGFTYDEKEVINFLNNKILGSDIEVTQHEEINVELNYSDLTQDLLSSIKEISNTDKSRVQRSEWIESFLR